MRGGLRSREARALVVVGGVMLIVAGQLPAGWVADDLRTLGERFVSRGQAVLERPRSVTPRPRHLRPVT